MDSKNIPKPSKRSYLRSLAGREYYTFKRRLEWLAKARTYARPARETRLEHSIFSHRSMLLRPLKDVEMYLQHNKITNLRLAIGRIDGVVIRPGETFSVWRLVGRPSKVKFPLFQISIKPTADSLVEACDFQKEISAGRHYYHSLNLKTTKQ